MSSHWVILATLPQALVSFIARSGGIFSCVQHPITLKICVLVDQDCAIVHMIFEHDLPTEPGAMSIFVWRTDSHQVVVLEKEALSILWPFHDSICPLPLGCFGCSDDKSQIVSRSSLSTNILTVFFIFHTILTFTGSKYDKTFSGIENPLLTDCVHTPKFVLKVCAIVRTFLKSFWIRLRTH